MNPELSISTGIDGDSVWDDFVESCEGADHLQTSAWGRVKAEDGWRPSRITLGAEGGIRAGAQLLEKRAPLAGGVAYIPRGPLVPGKDAETAELLIRELQEFAVRQRIRHLIVQPARNDEWLAELLPTWGFVESAVSVAPTASVLIDLTSSLDEIHQRMSRSARRHARRGAEVGVELREGDHRDLGALHSILQATGRRNRFRTRSLASLETMWETLRSRGHIRLFLAEIRDELVSGQLVVPFGDILLTKLAAWSGEHASTYPNESLELYIIAWAHQHGYRYYDMEGFDRATAEAMAAGAIPSTEQQRSTDAFKLKFGGDVVLLPQAFDHFPSMIVAKTYGRVYRGATSGGRLDAYIARLRNA